ncbi:hypothetical protein [Streptomyces sp. DH37]|uniref:hypothetical protein n=1 Tax=Streptomyces sp. DH37 TaxID=3040122 RepID=UPI002442E224|nr:hypothetical protein [Streptomyces sp. DH37]MDG9703837.1 hypothetical protein [Streptomyces sp. DH37]
MPIRAQVITVTGQEVRTGDVIAVGGNDHTVRNIRRLQNRRVALEFEDGNRYVLGEDRPIEVRRSYRRT